MRPFAAQHDRGFGWRQIFIREERDSPVAFARNMQEMKPVSGRVVAVREPFGIPGDEGRIGHGRLMACRAGGTQSGFLCGGTPGPSFGKLQVGDFAAYGFGTGS